MKLYFILFTLLFYANLQTIDQTKITRERNIEKTTPPQVKKPIKKIDPALVKEGPLSQVIQN